MLNFEAQLAFQGWTSDQLALLRQVGNDDQIIETARRIIFTQDVNVVAGRIPAAFASPAFISFLRQAGRDLTPFVGVPGNANCRGVSVSALAAQFGGIANAATALGFGSVSDLQNAIRGFCGQ